MFKTFWTSALSLLFATTISASEIVDYNRIIAIVNGDIVTASELKDELGRIILQLREKGVTLPAQNILEKQVLEKVILQRLQLQEAEAAGINTSDEELNRAIKSIATRNNLSLRGFRDVLEQEGITYSGFRESLRKDITLKRVRSYKIDKKIKVSEREIDNLLINRENEKQNNEYHLRHILISIPEEATDKQINTATKKANRVLKELRAGGDFSKIAASNSSSSTALDGGDLGWRKAGALPSLFSRIVPEMQMGEVSDIINSASGLHIIKLEARRGVGGKHIIDQTKVRHILIKTNQLVSNADAENRLLQLRERIVGGDDFALLAKANSDDGSARKGGDLGWMISSDLVPEFAEVMEKSSINSVSMPFKSRFGWHILEVLERRKHDDTQNFLRSEIKKQIHARKLEEESQMWLQRLRDEAYIEYRLEEE